MGALSKKKQSNTLFDMILVLVGSICSPSSGSVPRPSNIQARSLAQICANYFGSPSSPTICRFESDILENKVGLILDQWADHWTKACKARRILPAYSVKHIPFIYLFQYVSIALSISTPLGHLTIRQEVSYELCNFINDIQWYTFEPQNAREYFLAYLCGSSLTLSLVGSPFILVENQPPPNDPESNAILHVRPGAQDVFVLW